MNNYFSKTKKNIMSMVIMAFLIAPAIQLHAAHAQAAISDIDGAGFGTHVGSYSGGPVDHPWYQFSSGPGPETITVKLTTTSWSSGSTVRSSAR